MQVLAHHIYEYQKGLRHLVLHTMRGADRDAAEAKLNVRGIDYLIVELRNGNINIFFGRRECVEVVRSFQGVPLNHLSDEQDFILGTMLGYDRAAQCQRYLKRKDAAAPLNVNQAKLVDFA